MKIVDLSHVMNVHTPGWVGYAGNKMYYAQNLQTVRIVAHAGTVQTSLLVPTFVALVASLAGMWLGQKFRSRLPEETFRRYFYAGMLLLGADLALHHLF